MLAAKNSSATVLEESLKKLFAAMMAADREHVGRLRRARAVGPSTPTPTPVPVPRSHRK